MSEGMYKPTGTGNARGSDRTALIVEDGRMKSGMVGGIELGPKTGEIQAEVSSRGIRS